MPDHDSVLFFRNTLLDWHQQISRPLPWKGIKNPYFIWLSEIILQQTRVEQGQPYYERFVMAYPRVEDLANASEDEVLKLWEGLGYYSRARNMHAAAKWIREEYNGEFPSDYASILALKGVGPYTAAAIASFAFNLPHAVVDGNVFRVLARVFGIELPIDSTAGKKHFAELAQSLLDPEQPGPYNQAIMDFGAIHCMPKVPLCGQCPYQATCVAYKNDTVATLPIKAKKIQKKDRFFNYLILNQGDKVVLQKRTKKDVWQGLHQFPLIEAKSPIGTWAELIQLSQWQELLGKQEPTLQFVSKPFRQVLSHQNIHAQFWELNFPASTDTFPVDFFWVEREDLHKFAFPKIIDWYLKDKSLYLKLY